MKDRIRVKISDLVFELAPLSYKQKIEIQNMILAGKQVEGSILCVRYALKGVEGIENIDGEPYELVFEGDGNTILSESCIDDILNIEDAMKLQLVCANLLAGIPKEVVNPNTGEPIEGIKILSANPKRAGRKKTKSR
jgi:hypothetical protein